MHTKSCITIASQLALILSLVGCATRNSDLLSTGTYQIEPAVLPMMVRVEEEASGNVEVSGVVKPLASDDVGVYGSLKLEIVDPDGATVQKQEVCFSPEWLMKRSRFRRSHNRLPRFRIVLSAVPRKGSTLRLSTSPFDKRCEGVEFDKLLSPRLPEAAR